MTQPAASPPQGTSGEFRLDVDLAREAVTALEDARGRLLTLRADAAEFGRLTAAAPSSRDLVSIEAFQLLGLKAAGGEGSLSFALDGAIVHVEDLIKKMKDDIAAQQSLDDQAARELRSL